MHPLYLGYTNGKISKWGLQPNPASAASKKSFETLGFSDFAFT